MQANKGIIYNIIQYMKYKVNKCENTVSSWIVNMPINWRIRYFCYLYCGGYLHSNDLVGDIHYDCRLCSYKDYHGCCFKVKSDWTCIVSAYIELKDMFSDYMKPYNKPIIRKIDNLINVNTVEELHKRIQDILVSWISIPVDTDGQYEIIEYAKTIIMNRFYKGEKYE